MKRGRAGSAVVVFIAGLWVAVAVLFLMFAARKRQAARPSTAQAPAAAAPAATLPEPLAAPSTASADSAQVPSDSAAASTETAAGPVASTAAGPSLDAASRTQGMEAAAAPQTAAESAAAPKAASGLPRPAPSELSPLDEEDPLPAPARSPAAASREQLVSQARAGRQAGQAHWMQRKYAESAAAYEEAYQRYRAAGDLEGQAASLHGLATARVWGLREPEADKLFEASAALYRKALSQARDRVDVDLELVLERAYANVLFGVIRRAMRLKDLDKADAAAAERLELYQKLGIVDGQAVAWQTLGEVAYASGRLADANRAYAVSARLYRRAGNDLGAKSSSAWVRRINKQLAGRPGRTPRPD